MGGRACIRGLPVSVGTILRSIGAGHSLESLLEHYAGLTREDVMEALQYAAFRVEQLEDYLSHPRVRAIVDPLGGAA
jgi:uncharacterized protein (DUF433 family)